MALLALPPSIPLPSHNSPLHTFVSGAYAQQHHGMGHGGEKGGRCGVDLSHCFLAMKLFFEGVC